jgi:NADH-ubiquinone oxidoreductase chain 3
MTSTTFFIIFIPILAVLLLSINLILAPHNPYQEKDSVFECGFHSFLGQNRTQFTVSFFVVGILFLLFDLEIVLVYPFSVSGYNNDTYGLLIMMVFFVLLTLGFIFELGKNALTIDSRQTSSYTNVETPISHAFLASSTSTPQPHSFASKPLQSDMGISEIVTEINTLLPQLAKFINQFTNTVAVSGINVFTDSIGNLSIDVPGSMTDNEANKINIKIGVIDRLITTRGQEINDLLQKGISLENKLKTEDNHYVSQLTEKIQEFKRLNELYKH